MDSRLIGYWRQWGPDIIRWIAAIGIFAAFAWVMTHFSKGLDYFDKFVLFR
jgi:hypothetical protein